MGSRRLPTDCPDCGLVADWGDFGPDPVDGTIDTHCRCDDRPAPPRKRYTTTIIVDHHDGYHLARLLESIVMNDTIEWDRKDGMPYIESVGGDRIIRHVEHDEYVIEADYNDALIEWHRAAVEERRKDAEFIARLARIREDEAEVLRRLSDKDSSGGGA